MNTATNNLNPRFTNNFDFLRLFAATYVVALHSFGLLGKLEDEPLRSWGSAQFNFSFIRLSLFFCISGYLVTKSTIQSGNLADFAWRRLLRIQPLLAVVTIISILIIGPLFTTLDTGTYFRQLDTWTYLRNIFPPTGIQYDLPGVFLNNSVESSVNGSLWTLVIEERLYIASMVIFLVSTAGRKRLYLILTITYNLLYIINTSIVHFSDSIIISGPAALYSLMYVNSGALFHLGIDFYRYKKYIWIPVLILLTLVAAHYNGYFFLTYIRHSTAGNAARILKILSQQNCTIWGLLLWHFSFLLPRTTMYHQPDKRQYLPSPAFYHNNPDHRSLGNCQLASS